MHELSIAQNIVSAAVDAAEHAGARRVTALHLRLGAFSGVEQGALLFCYDVAARGTVLEGAPLHIEDVPLIVHCAHCNLDVALPSTQLFCCPNCGNPTTDIRQGKELELVSLEIEDDDPTA